MPDKDIVDTSSSTDRRMSRLALPGSEELYSPLSLEPPPEPDTSPIREGTRQLLVYAMNGII